MNENESVRSIIEATLNDPKIAATVAAGTTSLGPAAYFDLIDGWLLRASSIIGIITSLMILGVWMINFEQAWRRRK